jgi:L-amino acid N-acyltransferase YncA
MITYGHSRSDAELQQLLDLQSANLPTHISETELQAEGFVTVNHDFELLKAMNTPYPHVVARDGESVIGYALVMLPAFRDRIPVLKPMFAEFDRAEFTGRRLSEVSYFVMGQVCIAKGYRGQGIFQGLYDQMKRQMSQHFEAIVTEVSLRNPRSLRAHAKVGFHTIREYRTAGGEDWAILLWDWQ